MQDRLGRGERPPGIRQALQHHQLAQARSPPGAGQARGLRDLGVGRKFTRQLNAARIHSVGDLTRATPGWIRRRYLDY